MVAVPSKCMVVYTVKLPQQRYVPMVVAGFVQLVRPRGTTSVCLNVSEWLMGTIV